jgi:hypothetical protein
VTLLLPSQSYTSIWNKRDRVRHAERLVFQLVEVLVTRKMLSEYWSRSAGFGWRLDSPPWERWHWWWYSGVVQDK